MADDKVAIWSNIDKLKTDVSQLHINAQIQQMQIDRLEKSVSQNHSALMSEIHGFRTDILAQIKPLCTQVNELQKETLREEGRAEERIKEEQRKDRSLSKFKAAISIAVGIIGILAWVGITGPHQ